MCYAISQRALGAGRKGQRGLCQTSISIREVWADRDTKYQSVVEARVKGKMPAVFWAIPTAGRGPGKNRVLLESRAR